MAITRSQAASSPRAANARRWTSIVCSTSSTRVTARWSSSSSAPPGVGTSVPMT